MALTLNHYSIRSADLDACRRFYTEVLGLAVGPRPEFPFPGLWMYEGDTTLWANAVVHIIGIDRNDPKGLQDYLGDRDDAALKGTQTGGVAPGEQGDQLTGDALKITQMMGNDPVAILKTMKGA